MRASTVLSLSAKPRDHIEVTRLCASAARELLASMEGKRNPKERSMARVAAAVGALMLACLWVVEASAQTTQSREIVVLAELRSLTLTRRDWAAEREAMAELPADAPIVISNACGRADATFRVIRSTAPLGREINVSDTIGEWCVSPWELARWHWLIVIDAETGALVESYPVFRQGGALFAEAERDTNRVRSEEVRRRLALTPLPEPLEYDVTGLPHEHLESWVSYRPALEMRDGKVWLVRAIAVNAIFPDATEESLEP